jgi:hypothetical protein
MGDDEVKPLLRLSAGLALMAALCLGATTAFAASSTTNFGKFVCTGGVIAPGTYTALTVTGACAIPSGTVIVNGDVHIKANAALDAAIPTATVVIAGNVWVGSNAIFLLGCSPHFGCTTTTTDRINGNVYGNGALAVIFHSNVVRGSITLNGGGGGYNCIPDPNLGGNPNFSDFEDNSINGYVKITNLHSCWLGVIRNNVHGTVTLENNKLADPDAIEVTTNKIFGNLVCFGNYHTPKFGDSGGTPNTVLGKKLGQCASL